LVVAFYVVVSDCHVYVCSRLILRIPWLVLLRLFLRVYVPSFVAFDYLVAFVSTLLRCSLRLVCSLRCVVVRLLPTFVVCFVVVVVVCCTTLPFTFTV
jgi:hypothetical protein